jgi:hypothetical protein
MPQFEDSEYAQRLRKQRWDLQKQIAAAEDELNEVERLLFGLTGFLGSSARTKKDAAE